MEEVKKKDKLSALRTVLSLAVHAAFIGFIVAMAFAVWKLGETYGQPMPYRYLVAGACALGVLGHGVSATREGTNVGRMMHGLALGVWLVLSVFLAGLYMVTSTPQFRDVLPAEMILIGGYVYALAFGIGLFTSVLALVVPSVAARPIEDGTTLGGSVARFGEPVVVMLCVAASSLHLFLFGQNVAKLDLFSVLAAMLIADLAFVVAEKRTISELRARRAGGRYDKFDLVLWGLFGLGVLVYLVFVNVYSVRFTAGTLDANDPMLQRVTDFYAASPAMLITALVDKPAGAPDASNDTVTIKRPTASRLADGIRAARAGRDEIGSALRGDAPARLPGAPVMAKDDPEAASPSAAVARRDADAAWEKAHAAWMANYADGAESDEARHAAFRAADAAWGKAEARATAASEANDALPGSAPAAGRPGQAATMADDATTGDGPEVVTIPQRVVKPEKPEKPLPASVTVELTPGPGVADYESARARGAARKSKSG
jgi:hypothetical protein